MICLCGGELKKRDRMNMELRTIAFTYYYCKKCDKNYDANKYEIILKGSTYTLKKDSTTPDGSMK